MYGAIAAVGFVRLRKVYSVELRYSRQNFNPRHTMEVYSFGWMYWGENTGLVELCENSLAKLMWNEKDDILKVEVLSVRESGCWEESLKQLSSVLGIDENLSDYIARARGDPLVGGVVEAMPGLHIRRTSVWYAFLVGVCQQNASFRQGWGMLYKLHLEASPRLLTPCGRVYLQTPPPSSITLERLRAAGLGYRASTVMALVSRRVWELDCNSIDEAASVKGVGPYTLSLAAVLSCRDYARLPLDRWLRRLAAEAYGVPEREAGREITRRFDGWRGLAAIHTTIGFDAEPLRRAVERLKKGLNKPGLSDPSPVTLWRHTPPPGLG